MDMGRTRQCGKKKKKVGYRARPLYIPQCALLKARHFFPRFLTYRPASKYLQCQRSCNQPSGPSILFVSPTPHQTSHPQNPLLLSHLPPSTPRIQPRNHNAATNNRLSRPSKPMSFVSGHVSPSFGLRALRRSGPVASRKRFHSSRLEQG